MKPYGGHYMTQYVYDNEDGYSGLELFRRADDGSTTRVARVIFWDACGQFYLETCGTDVPVTVLEQLIAETRAAVKTS
jgi:hypothetical protein